MRAKHLLFSSIFLTMGFAACTNEVEEFNTQSANVEATDLGKDFVIGVTKSGFNADAETRAALSYDAGQWVAAWGKDADGNPDAIGAAWFNKSNWKEGDYVSGSAKIMYIGGEYASNNEFVHQEGNTFKSEANSKTGAYVLYYPFDASITDNMANIPVKPIKENNFDCNEIEKYVNQNIFAASVANFFKSGTQAPSFTVEQIPVLYAISFYVKDQNMLTLADKIEITHVMVEATKGGKPALNTEGIIQPQGGSFEITNDQYKGLKPMPKIDFVGEESSRIDRMMIKVENSNDEYCISDLGKSGETANFYFSMLPTEEFDKVSFKIVGKMGGKTIVLGASKEEVDFEDFAASIQKMNKSGQVVNLGVGLDHVHSVENGIYSEEQFIEYWNAAEIDVFDIQVPDLDLSDNELNFTLPQGKAVTFKGMPIKLPTINGNYTFAQNVEIVGDATLTGGKTAEINVSGNLTVDAGTKSVTIKKATVGGKLNTNGKVTISGASQIKSSVTVASGSLSLAKGTEVGSISVNKHKELGGATLTANGTTIKGALTVAAGAEAIMKGTWKAASVKVYGKLTQADVNANGTVTKEFTVTKKSDVQPELAMSQGKIEMSSLVVNSDITGVVFGCEIINIGKITASSPVTFNGQIQTVGDVTANAAVTFGNNVGTVADITATKDVTFKGAVKSVDNIGTTEARATGKITFEKTAEKVGQIITDAEVTFNEMATIAAINTTADVNFKEATIEGDLTVKGKELKVMATNLTVNGTVDLDNEVTLTATTLTANAIELETYCQVTADGDLTVEDKLTANGKVNAGNTSDIKELAIAPNVVVDLAKAKITKLDVQKKLTYVGTLNATDLTVVGGENNGVINATTSTTIEGAFTQKATLNTPSITVAKDEVNGINGILNVDTEMSESIINNGTVNVNAKAENVENDGILNLNGTATVSNKANGVVNVSESGILNLSNNNDGTIYVKNKSKVNADTYNTGVVVYVWEGTDKPAKTSSANNLSIITKLEMVNAQVSSLKDLTNVTKLDAISIKGNYIIPAIASTHAIAAIPVTVDGEATIDAYDSDGIDKKPVNVTINEINVPNGAKFNITEYIKFQSGTNIKLGGNNTINGNIGDAIYSNM